MKLYHKRMMIALLRDVLIGLIIGVLMVGMFFGAAIQHQDRSAALAVMEVQG